MSRLARASIPCIALLLLAGCSPPANDEPIEFRAPVFVREVAAGTVEDRITATGTVRAPESVALRAETAGTLEITRRDNGRRLAEGDHVEAGDLLAMITGEDVKLAARTEATEQRYLAAQRDYDTKKELLEEGLISEETYRPAKATLAEARADWERSLLTESRSRLVTPIAGMILRLARDEDNLPLGDGQLVTQGYLVAQVAPTDSLIADVDLVGPDVSRVREGLPALLRYHAWDERMFEGRVERLAPTLDPATRTLRAEISVANPEGLLRPGMFVEVIMIAERREDVAVVPREALTERGGRKVVFVLEGQQVTQREVTLGLGDDEVVEIREGVELGERIVVRGLETLQDGARVRVTGA